MKQKPSFAIFFLPLLFSMLSYCAFAEDLSSSVTTPTTSEIVVKPLASMATSENLSLIATTVDTLNSPIPGTPEGASYTQIDTAQVNCPSGLTCLIVVNLTLQGGKNSAAANHWGFCSKVDGQWIEPNSPAGGCLWQGLLPSDTWFVTGNVTGSKNVGPGQHSIQTVVFFQSPASVGQGQFQYSVYKH